ncbi:MAG TPA: hypothetical protein VM031_04330 [Phycisphaerae bacterium]|nr:hypothetical protein [Phycisphaerae bacterium]
MKRNVTVVLVGIVVLVSAAPALAEDVQQTYDSLFGAEAKKVIATFGKADDAAFAKKLLDGAAGVSDSPKLQVLLYEKAYEFGVKHKDGYATAVEAMKRLAAAAPDRKADCDGKLLEVYERQYRSSGRAERTTTGSVLAEHLLSLADAELAGGKTAEAVKHYRRAYFVAKQVRSPQAKAISARIKLALARERVERDLARLEKALKEDPENQATARKLLMLHLVERDDPNKAAGLLPSIGSDEVLRTYVPLLGRDWKQLPETAYLELGAWYASLADRASAAARPRMLLRAKAYYEGYLELHGKKDASALQAKGLLRKVEKQLEQFPDAMAGRPGGTATAVGPPKGVSIGIIRWAKQRDDLPIKERLDALAKKLSEVNRGREIKIKGHKIEDGRIVRLGVERNKDLVSIAPLYGMKLTRLDLSACPVTSLEPLKGMPLTSLGIGGSRVKSLEGLEGMPLEDLTMVSCPVTSLEPLMGMRLKKLNLDNCKSLKNLSPILDMPLADLNLTKTRITSLAPLRGMKLKNLNLTRCGRLVDLTGLQGMPLVELKLERTAITTLAPLKGLQLEKLDLAYCTSLRSLKGIETLPLTKLCLDGVPITSCSALKGMKLEYLSAASCTVLKSLKGLEGMPLRELYLRETRITSLTPLKGTKLRDLGLERCRSLKSLAGIGDLPLVTLRLSETPLTSLAPLKGLKLQKLWLDGCTHLKSLEGLEDMPLRELYMGGSGVTSLAPLKGLRIHRLAVDGCKSLKSLSGIEDMPLDYLDLRGTRFAKQQSEESLKKKIPTLKEVKLK